MRRGATVRADLYNTIVRARRLQHRLAFADGMCRGLFDVNVRARFHRRDGGQRVPVVGRRDDHDLRLFFREQFAVVAIFSRLVPAQLRDLFHARIERALIDIAYAHDLALAARHRFANDIATPPTGADQSRAMFASSLVGCTDVQTREGSSRECRLKKRAAIHGECDGERIEQRDTTPRYSSLTSSGWFVPAWIIQPITGHATQREPTPHSCRRLPANYANRRET